MTFKVGDKIRGISDNFKITNKDMTLAEVMGVEPLGIKIKILEHTNKSQIGKMCLAITLEEHLAHFELVEENKMSTLEELEKKYKELGEEIDKLKAEKENEPWKPKDGERYWFVSHSGGEESTIWDGVPVDVRMYELGNVFKTKEEAEFRAEQLKVEAELRRFTRPFVVNQGNFMLRYDHDRNEILIEDFAFIQFSNIYFTSKEIAQKAIDTVGEERIKKYYFGVIN